jgi:hypothetical protein
MTTPEKTLKDIMPKGEWDWEGVDLCQLEDCEIDYEDNCIGINAQDWIKCISLADLLANKSWCKAVWGKEWEKASVYAFHLLLITGQQACINYIYQTKS